ncbi:MAG TPA: BLUF domain-containing protein [Phycisphaerae bacterium]|nr:BLUF domain-containing protein [Phycisphaerae bacterium]
MLVRLIYASRSTKPINDDMIQNILDQSGRHNVDAGITGVLCVCHGDIFMQVLEGGREEVNQLYAKLVRDARHTDVTLLDYAEISERRFSSWRMGRVDLDKLNLGIVLKYSEKPQLDPFQLSGRVALALLEELMSTAAIMGGG